MKGCDQRLSQELFYQLFSVAIIASSMFVPQKPLKFSRLNMWLGILMLAFVYSYVKSMDGWWKVALNYMLGLMVYVSFIKTMTREDIKFIFKGILGVGVAGLVYLVFQKFGIDLRGTVNAGDYARVDTTSFFFQKSAMGMYYASILPIIASVSLYLIPIFLIPVVLSKSAFAILGGLTAYFIFLWFRNRIVFWVCLIPAVLGALYFGFTKENLTGFTVRLPVWREVFQDITQNPLGQGLESFVNGKCRYVRDIETDKVARFVKDGKDYRLYDRVDNVGIVSKVIDNKANLEFVDHPHSEYLWFGYELGMQSWVILGFIFYYAYRRFKVSRRDALTVACFGYLISFAIFSIAQFPLHLARVAHLLPIVAGCFYIATEDE
jgi:hypothetical protein